MCIEALSLFDEKLIRTNYFARFPRATHASRPALKQDIYLDNLLEKENSSGGSMMLLTLTSVIMWIVRMRQRAPWTIKCIRVTVIQSDEPN